MYRLIHVLILLYIIQVLSSCTSDPRPTNSYKTENVVIIVMDGARYSETWGDPTHQNIPSISKIANKGFIKTNFYNSGVTKTVPGHVAILTGNYQEINNSGLEIPESPSIMQLWRQQKNEDKLSAWIISSKDKLEVLANTTDVEWKDKYIPYTNCGLNGLGTGYRHDSITYKVALKVMRKYEPNLVLVNFREPDYTGHLANWEGYLEGIRLTDYYIDGIWKLINEHKSYKDKTALFITNDHGRHLDSIGNGYVSHGDDCEGCRHINLIAIGPDFKVGIQDSTRREQIDISATVAKLLDIQMTSSDGDFMSEMIIGL